MLKELRNCTNLLLYFVSTQTLYAPVSNKATRSQVISLTNIKTQLFLAAGLMRRDVLMCAVYLRAYMLMNLACSRYVCG